MTGIFGVSQNADECMEFKFEAIEFSKLTKEERSLIEKFRQDKSFFSYSKKDDTWKFNFQLFFTYYGKSMELLECVEALVDNNRIMTMSTKELFKGKCLIQDVLNKIEKIEGKYGQGKTS